MSLLGILDAHIRQHLRRIDAHRTVNIINPVAACIAALKGQNMNDDIEHRAYDLIERDDTIGTIDHLLKSVGYAIHEERETRHDVWVEACPPGMALRTFGSCPVRYWFTWGAKGMASYETGEYWPEERQASSEALVHWFANAQIPRALPVAVSGLAAATQRAALLTDALQEALNEFSASRPVICDCVLDLLNDAMTLRQSIERLEHNVGAEKRTRDADAAEAERIRTTCKVAHVGADDPVVTPLAVLDRHEDGYFVFEHHGIEIKDPTRSECGRFPASPDYYGFQIDSTGGGCTAWVREFTYLNKPATMVITDDASHKLGPVCDVCVYGCGAYDWTGGDAPWYVAWTLTSGAEEPISAVLADGEVPTGDEEVPHE